jgi:site-specific DNA recombinase
VRVALYLRVSTEEQRERQSIETQRDFGERFCQLHQLQTVRFYVDDGVSGTVAMELRSAGKQVLDCQSVRPRKYRYCSKYSRILSEAVRR